MHDVGHPHAFDADDVEAMPEPSTDPADDEHRLVAVGAISGVEKTEGTLRDAARVLYMSLDGQFATEFVVSRASAQTPGKIDAEKHTAAVSMVGQPSETVVSKHAEALEAHRERLGGGQ